ncbi:MAG: cation-translocating P-type ATPase [Anaerolineae bacterium]|nr:cation-translocating P-type ATPase [Anaerolineae bacterium]
MIVQFRNTLRNPRQRTQLESAASGVLILGGLAARYLFGATLAHNGLMAAAALIAGADIAMRAWNSLRNRHISIELLVTIATVGALAIGEFWEAAAVTFLFVFGAYLEARTLSRTRKVLGELLDLAPVTALVLRDGQQVEVAPHEVAVGEIVLIKPGARVPVDGEVVAGASAVDESSITGEPIPEEKFAGLPVFAGTVNLDGMLQARATGVGADTTLARIIARVEEAQEEKAPTQRFIERFARWYTPAIILLSAAVYAITRDIELALTLLVIACPGALVISTPVSIIAGIGQAARRGILIKGGEYLENAARISALALDKTGTITYGKPRLTEIFVLQPSRIGLPEEVNSSVSFNSTRWTVEQAEILYWAGIAESVSEHPLARAIYNEARTLTALPTPDTFETFTGKGIQARFMGHEISVGTEKWLKEQSVAIEPGVESALLTLREEGKTATLVSLDSMLMGILGISDPIRETSAETIKRLAHSGIREVVMLTGDDEKTAWAIARQAGIKNVKANLLPEDKLKIIRELQSKGHTVAMVGDGINDTPALAAADIGIAMGAAGAGLAIETADVALMSDDLLKVPEAIRLSKATLRNIRQNVAIALITVGALLSGVLLGEVHMAGGMLVHQLSVLIVIFNGMRLLREGSGA